jgi:hypothetical protein
LNRSFDASGPWTLLLTAVTRDQRISRSRQILVRDKIAHLLRVALIAKPR